ncbi:Gamma-aminobutyrate:alpha-ketoglutarate aminotransferase [Klebsiella pneumoniae]|nr:Gamma-aminobutyrate:alpha-ketoglutarate aminotransferase [Klebsiella pneumoniae]
MEPYPEVRVDLMTMAKSLAGGMPLSAVAGRADVMDAPGVGGLGSTYAGNPLAVAAAHAVIDIIDEEKLCERAQRLGKQLTGMLEEMKHRNSAIADIRARGSMVAVEFNDPVTGNPSPLLISKSMVSLWLNVITLVLITFFIVMMYVSA